MKLRKIKKLRKYFIFFMMYGVVGWLYEVFLEVVVYKWGFSNRGVLFGPYLPIYGFGALVFIILFYADCIRSLYVRIHAQQHCRCLFLYVLL